MKLTFILVLSITFNLITHAAGGSQYVEEVDFEKSFGHLQEIAESTHSTADNTAFGVWDGVSIFLAIASLIFSIFTFYSQRSTEGNTRKLSMDAQKSLLFDLVRHLYRNLVITYAIKTKLEDCGYDGYPSEEHLTKLKVPMENIHLEVFYGKDKEYELMHNLYLNLRNYNEEIQVANEHMTEMKMSVNDVKRDLGTLLFKPDFLLGRIAEVIRTIWPCDVAKVIRQQIAIAQSGERNAKGNKVSENIEFSPFEIPETSSFRNIFTDSSDLTSFIEKFHDDVRVEWGINSQGTDKVYIIKSKRLNTKD